jgi:hypothetical protein
MTGHVTGHEMIDLGEGAAGHVTGMIRDVADHVSVGVNIEYEHVLHVCARGCVFLTLVIVWSRNNPGMQYYVFLLYTGTPMYVGSQASCVFIENEKSFCALASTCM